MKSSFLLFLFFFLFLIDNELLSQNSTKIVKDERDGQTYNIVFWADQWWFAENLNFETANSWFYNDTASNGKIYGRLYTWDAALTACPSGWHLPADEDWQNLERNFGLPETSLLSNGWRGDSTIAFKFRAFSANLIKDSTAVPGFNAPLSGYRKHTQIAGFIHRISYEQMGQTTGFWTSTKSGSYSYYRFLDKNKSGILRYKYFRKTGFCVRCVKDKED